MYVCSWLHCHNVNKTFTISHKTSALFIQELVTLRALETRCMPFQIGSYLEDKLVVNLTSTSHTSSHFVEATSSIGGCCCGWWNWRCCPGTCKKSTNRCQGGIIRKKIDLAKKVVLKKSQTEVAAGVGRPARGSCGRCVKCKLPDCGKCAACVGGNTVQGLRGCARKVCRNKGRRSVRGSTWELWPICYQMCFILGAQLMITFLHFLLSHCTMWMQ